MRTMAMLHRYRLKSTTLRKRCAMYLCMYFKTATALELLANNFCFSVKLFVGVAHVTPLLFWAKDGPCTCCLRGQSLFC